MSGCKHVFASRSLAGRGSTPSIRGPGACLATRRDVLNTVIAVSPLLIARPGRAEPTQPGIPVGRTDLAPDLNISQVIKGCWQLSGGHRGDSATDRTAGSLAVEDFGKFVRAGVTTFDAADHYGPAEKLIGRYLARAPASERDAVQALTKLCVFRGSDMAGLDREMVKQAVDLSRSRLGVDTVDLMQFYWQDYGIKKYVDGVKYLGDMQAEGRIRHVGVTNFDVPRVQEMMDTGVNIVSNQVQYSLLDRRPEVAMTQLCASTGMRLLPYGVLAGGLLSDKYLGAPSSTVRLDTYSKSKYSQVLQEAGGWTWFQSLLEVLQSIAQRHATTISVVAARWVLQKPAVAAVILGARNADHVQDDQAIFSFELDAQDLQSIEEVLSRGRQATGDCYAWERGGQW